MPVAPPAGTEMGTLAEELETPQEQQRHQVADVQAVGRRVEAGVDRDRSLPQAVPQDLEIGVVVNQTATTRSSMISSPVPVASLAHGGHFSRAARPPGPSWMGSPHPRRPAP